MVGTEDVTNPGLPQSLQPTAKQAGLAVTAAAATAIAAAAQNASKPGRSTTEFKTTLGSIVLAAVVGGLHVFSVVPGPWTLPAVLGLVAISAGSAAYTVSRGSVKKAALAGASAAVTAAAYNALPPRPTEDPELPEATP